MSYVENVLEPGEHMRYRTSISWIIYINGLMVAILAIAAAALAVELYAGWMFIVAGILGLAAIWLLGRALLKRLTTEIAVTDRRIIVKRGLIRRHTMEMNMQKVESVDVDQTLLGRLFNYGDVTVRGIGSTFEPLTFIDAPLKLRSTVTAG